VRVMRCRASRAEPEGVAILTAARPAEATIRHEFPIPKRSLHEGRIDPIYPRID
jgi:hypothetical protein